MLIMGFGAESMPLRMRSPSPPQKSTTFMSPSWMESSEDLEMRNRHHEPRSPRTGVRELVQDLFTEVPRKDHDVVGTHLVQPFGRIHRDVRPRQEHPLLVR